MPETWTTLKLIRWTTDFFGKKGIPNPRLDAELLLSWILQSPRIHLYTDHEKKITDKDLERFKRLIERRARREPLQQILGETEFWGLKIKVGPAVLIPRPETELLVEEVLKRSPLSILDIGTGSGCIAIALAKAIPNAEVVATDSSKEALLLAEKNAALHGVEKRIQFLLADIAPWRRFEAEGRCFDCIVSNPPYIPTGDFPALQPEVRDFEPRLALDGGPDGLSIIRKIIDEAKLKPSGSLVFEIGDGQATPVRELVEGRRSLQLKEVKRDYSGVERIVVSLSIVKDGFPHSGGTLGT